MIKIHYDFVDGSEISYDEGKTKKDGFNTNCLSFFTMENEADEVLVVKKDGSYISRNNINEHSAKEIRASHNIYKMLIAGAFEWRSENFEIVSTIPLYAKLYGNYVQMNDRFNSVHIWTYDLAVRNGGR